MAEADKESSMLHGSETWPVRKENELHFSMHPMQSTKYAFYIFNNITNKLQKICITRNTFYGTRYLSHCYARRVFNPLFVNWVTSLTPRCHVM